MLSRGLIVVFLLVVVTVCGYFYLDKKEGFVIFNYQTRHFDLSSLPNNYSNEEKEPESENPIERFEYEYNRLANPITGKIPKDIKEKELAYAKEFLRPNDFTNNRLGASPFSVRSQAVGVVQNSENFINMGPFNIGGRTRAVAIDTQNENILIAGGISGGIWKSTDQGASWERKSALQDHPAVSSLVQDKRSGHTQEWYYSTGEFKGNSASGRGAFYLGNGIYKSMDNGDSWQLIASTAQPGTEGTDVIVSARRFTVTDQLAIDYSEPSGSEIYSSGLSEVIRSTDGFETFQVVLGANNSGSNFTDVAITSTGKVFATIGNSSFNGSSAQDGLFMSDDGISWTQIEPDSNFPSTFDRMEIAIDPSDENKVYFVGSSRMFLFNDSDDSWTDLSSNLGTAGNDIGEGHSTQGGYDLYAAIHPSNPDVVFVGGVNLIRSENAFTNQSGKRQIGGYNNDNNPNSFPRYPNHHPDNHSYAFFPSNPDKMITATDGGLHITENNQANVTIANAVSWRSLNNGYITSQFYHTSMNITDLGDPIIMGGMQDNGTWGKTSDDPEENWEEIFSGDGAFTAVSYNSIYPSSQRGNLIRLELNGDDYEFTGNISPSENDSEFQFINPFIMNPVNQDQMFVAGNAKIYFTNDVRLNPGEGEWGELSSRFLSLQPISALAMSVQPEGVLYAGTTNGRIYKVNNTRNLLEGQVDEQINVTNMPNGNVSGIAVDPTDADKVLVCFSNYQVQSIWYTKDGGETWSHVSGNLEENPDGSGSGPSVRAVSILPDGNGGSYFFVGTSVGLYMTNALDGDNTNWNQQASEVIGNVVVTSIGTRPIEGLILVGTHGNGVFQAKYDVGVVPSINYSVDLSGTSYTLRGNKSFDPNTPLSYQWLKNGEDIDGENGPELSVDDGGDYQLLVGKPGGLSGLSNIVSINLDGQQPSIVSIERFNPIETETTSSTVIFKVTFDESVVNVSTGDFVTAGAASGSIGNVAVVNSGIEFNVEVNNIGGTGDLSLMVATSNNIEDEAGNSFSGVVGQSEAYQITDNTAPTVSIVRENPVNEITNQNELDFRVNFSESVVNVGIEDFELASSTAQATISSVTDLGLGISYFVSITDISQDGLIDLNFSTSQDIVDGAGNSFDGNIVSEQTYMVENVIASIDDFLILTSDKIIVDTNPSSTGIFKLALPSKYTGAVILRTISANGNIIGQTAIEDYTRGQQIHLDLSQQPDGLYVIRVSNPVSTETVKLLKRSN